MRALGRAARRGPVGAPSKAGALGRRASSAASSTDNDTFSGWPRETYDEEDAMERREYDEKLLAFRRAEGPHELEVQEKALQKMVRPIASACMWRTTVEHPVDMALAPRFPKTMMARLVHEDLPFGFLNTAQVCHKVAPFYENLQRRGSEQEQAALMEIVGDADLLCEGASLVYQDAVRIHNLAAAACIAHLAEEVGDPMTSPGANVKVPKEYDGFFSSRQAGVSWALRAQRAWNPILFRAVERQFRFQHAMQCFSKLDPVPADALKVELLRVWIEEGNPLVSDTTELAADDTPQPVPKSLVVGPVEFEWAGSLRSMGFHLLSGIIGDLAESVLPPPRRIVAAFRITADEREVVFEPANPDPVLAAQMPRERYIELETPFTSRDGTGISWTLRNINKAVLPKDGVEKLLEEYRT